MNFRNPTCSRGVLSALCCLWLYGVACEPHAASHFFDAEGRRTWKTCEFQAIGPLDQVIFNLLGGTTNKLGKKCTIWDSPTRGHCPCSAPLDMLGPNHTVVEIGANDGLHMSNSRFFDMQLHWRSLCVEANAQVYNRLVKNRPDCITVNALVAKHEDLNVSYGGRVPYISFYRNAGNEKRDTSRDWETGVSGIESPSASNLEIRSYDRAKRFASRSGLEVQRDYLPVVPFSVLFAKHGIRRIDLMTVDVEGAEHSVIRSIDFSAVLIRLMVIEKPSEKTVDLLRANGFQEIDLVTQLADRFFHNAHWFPDPFAHDTLKAKKRRDTKSALFSGA